MNCLVLLNGKCFTLRCYSCSSITESKCLDPFKSYEVPIEYCSQTETACTVYYQFKKYFNKILFIFEYSKKKVINNAGSIAIIRGCSNLGTCNTQICTGLNSHSSSTFYCTTENCNGSSILKSKFNNFWIILIFGSIFYFGKYRF